MVNNRLPWRDRFNEPTPKDLRRALPKEAATLFDTARTHFRKLDGLAETVAWYGHCWCWSIEYRTNPKSEPFAVIIPSPEDLQLAMPLEQAFMTTLPMKRLKRAIRDGLDLAQKPFDTRWGVWSIQQRSMWEDLKDLIKRKMEHQASG